MGDLILSRAITNKNVEIVRLLLARGAHANAHTMANDSLLNFAIGYKSDDMKEIVALLIDNGASLKEVDYYGETALTRMVGYTPNKEIAGILLDKGADINAANGVGNTSLHHAAANGNREMVAFLIEREADVNIQNQDGERPLTLAVKRKFTDVAAMLRAADARE